MDLEKFKDTYLKVTDQSSVFKPHDLFILGEYEKAKPWSDQVEASIDEFGLEKFVDAYLKAVGQSSVFEPDELFLSDLEELDEDLSLLRKKYWEIMNEAKKEFIRKNGAKIPKNKWAKAFGYLTMQKEIEEKVFHLTIGNGFKGGKGKEEE